MSSSNLKGFILAVVSSAFIGSSFIIKKKGLRRAGVNGPRAGSGGYGYLREPLWWIGMVTMVVGEISNFVAYIYAPAGLVTPLGALSIIVSAVLAHFLLKEKLQKMGMLGCLLCIVGSTVIVLHAPEEQTLNSVEEIWDLAIQPAFLLYTASVIAVTLVLILYCSPRYGQTNILIYIGICSIIGSLTVMSVKAIGIAIKLTIEGTNQIVYFQTWIFAMVSVTCIITQLNYLNMALDTFNTAIVSPIYYAMFTSFTILASAIMYKDYSGQSASSIASELCGFIIVLSGTAILHSTREPNPPLITDLYTPLSPKVSWYIQSNGEWKQKDDEGSTPNFITEAKQDLELMGRWEMIDLCDALELLSPVFESEEGLEPPIGDALRSVHMLSVFLKELTTKNSNVIYFNWFRLFDLSALISPALLISSYNVLAAGMHGDEDGFKLWQSLVRQTDLTAQLCSITRDVRNVRGNTP